MASSGWGGEEIGGGTTIPSTEKVVPSSWAICRKAANGGGVFPFSYNRIISRRTFSAAASFFWGYFFPRRAVLISVPSFICQVGGIEFGIDFSYMSNIIGLIIQNAKYN